MQGVSCMKTPGFMIIPSLACQASCTYCFGPHEGAVMDEYTASETVAFIASVAEETSARELSIVFHGGEPLLAPLSVWEVLLSSIKTRLAGYQVKMNLQSNLWNLTEEHIRLFLEYGVSLGTSLDGPEALCDCTRGQGYFKRTYAAVKKAQEAGSSVSAIATVSKQTLPHAQSIAAFFRDSDIPLVLHGALPPLGKQQIAPSLPSWTLSSSDYAELILGLFPWYIENRKYVRISTLDHFATGIVHGKPGVCTFQDCLGMFLAIAPTGEITSCQRFAGQSDFCMGSIFERPTLTELSVSPAAKRQKAREESVAERCQACEHYALCKGGCYYNALASGDGVLDPWCEAYQQIYAFVLEQVVKEMRSPENIAAVRERPAYPDEHPFLRVGNYTSLASSQHPTHVADNARRILAIYELGAKNDPRRAAESLFEQRICGDVALTEALLTSIRSGLHPESTSRNNFYVHVTSACDLACAHCYAQAGDRNDEMGVAEFSWLIDEVIEAGFRQLVITGGEPLVHTHLQELLEICRKNKGRGVNLVLRTNYHRSLDEDDCRALAQSLDQVVVSVDGNEQSHDARRGAGSYTKTVKNLQRYTKTVENLQRDMSTSASDASLKPAKLSLACVMKAEDINGEPGLNVRRLGEQLGIQRLRFRPLLPLGRAALSDEPVMCEGLMQHVSPEEMLRAEFHPLSTCGIGQNLYVRPDGAAHPCYAWCGEETLIGNVVSDGVAAVLDSPEFTRLAGCTVDTVETCRTCGYRYLCGGACRAWGRQDEQNLYAAPPQCDHLKRRAQKLIDVARAFIRG